MTNAEYNAGYLSVAAMEAVADAGLQWLLGGPILAALGRPGLLLRRWRGRRAPVVESPTAVGFAWGDEADEVAEHASVDHPDAVWWYRVDRVNRCGVASRGSGAVPRVWDDSADVGDLPNNPSGLARVQVGSAVRLSWIYEPAGQQAPPDRFDVFGGDPMDWQTVVASVPYVAGRRRYAWKSGEMTDGDVAQFSVRARSAAGVYSLIPEVQDLHTGASALYGEGTGLKTLVRVVELPAPVVLVD
ncbi:MAG TPA: hypothetical protein PKC49_00330 [Phycisphaerae bacterium]|nr:hypothetical protein [Phycisphaerae bacterium]